MMHKIGDLNYAAMTAIGPTRTFLDVCFSAAIKGIADSARAQSSKPTG